MGKFDGTASAEIDAPIAEVYRVASDVEGLRRWIPEIEVSECLKRDDNGNQVRVRMEADAKVRRICIDARFNYEEPSRISWVQEDGDLSALQGSWELEDLGEGRTRATYWLEIDMGRTPSMLIRGPLVGAVRGQLVDPVPARLKRFVEDESS